MRISSGPIKLELETFCQVNIVANELLLPVEFLKKLLLQYNFKYLSKFACTSSPEQLLFNIMVPTLMTLLGTGYECPFQIKLLYFQIYIL